jgi:hypothetical protein
VRPYLQFVLYGAISHEHPDKFAQLFLEDEITLIVEDVFDVSSHNVVEGVVLLLEIVEEAGQEPLVVVYLEVLEVDLHSLSIGAAVLQEPLDIAFHEFVFEEPASLLLAVSVGCSVPVPSINVLRRQQKLETAFEFAVLRHTQYLILEQIDFELPDAGTCLQLDSCEEFQQSLRIVDVVDLNESRCTDSSSSSSYSSFWSLLVTVRNARMMCSHHRSLSACTSGRLSFSRGTRLTVLLLQFWATLLSWSSKPRAAKALLTSSTVGCQPSLRLRSRCWTTSLRMLQ